MSMNLQKRMGTFIYCKTSVKKLKNQQGAVLLVSLIMLLLLTVVGTAAMNLSVLDSRMTANARDRQIAFQAAEAGLIAAEFQLQDQSIDIDVGITDGYLGADQTADSWWFAQDKSWWQAQGGDIAGFSSHESPFFVIEEPVSGSYKAVAGPNGISQNLGAGNKFSSVEKEWYNFYDVTSRGEGPGGSKVALQTNYARRTYNPE